MHQCLEIPEILEIICKILKNDFDNNVNRESLSTLSSLARTCRCFHELALDILWHSLDSLVPLLKTFPCSLWNVAQVANGETLLYFRRQINSRDLSRLSHYAKRVKVIHISTAQGIVPEVLRSLSLSLPRSCPLLPNLRQLHWNVVDETIFSHISMMLCPSITRIAILLRGSQVTRLSLLPSLHASCPSIEEIFFYGQIRNPDAMFATSEHLCGWKTLSSVCVGALTPGALGHLATMPTLRCLSTGIAEEVSFRDVPATFKGPAFRHLHELHLDASNASLCASVFALMVACPLREISLHTSTLSSASTWSNCYGRLKSHISLDTLSMISIIEDEITTQEFAESYPVGGDMLKPIHAFHGLTNVSLQHVCFALEDADVRDMALAWPLLRHLSIGTVHGCAGLSRVTLRALCSLAEHCQDLGYVGIVMDATIPVSLSPESLGASGHKLQTLDVGDSRISDPVWIAAFLSGVFATVDHVECSYDGRTTVREDAQEYEKYWNTVQQLIPVFGAVRTQERDRHSC